MEWNYSEETAKVVTKPWGKEVWLNYVSGERVGENEKRYAFKKLYINSGTKTSFQYHEKKEETNFLVKGRVEAWFETAPGYIEKKVLQAGAIWNIPKNVKHRILHVFPRQCLISDIINYLPLLVHNIIIF